MKKFFAVSIGICLIAAACNKQAAVNNFQNPPPHVNVKDYSGADYGFTFQYPADWTMTDQTNGDPNPKTQVHAVEVANSSMAFSGSNYEYIFFSTSLTKNSLSTEGLTNLNQQMFVGGVSWQAFKGATGAGNQDSLELTAAHSNKYFEIELYPYSKTGANTELNQVLSNFKFTDSASSAANWKTYTNTEYGYSIQYPDIVQTIGNGSVTNREYAISLGGNATLLITAHDPASAYSAKNLQYKDIIINGISVKQNQSFDNKNLSIISLFTGKQYVYELDFNDDHDSTKVDLLNQVLATFKFTK